MIFKNTRYLIKYDLKKKTVFIKILWSKWRKAYECEGNEWVEFARNNNESRGDVSSHTESLAYSHHYTQPCKRRSSVVLSGSFVEKSMSIR